MTDKTQPFQPQVIYFDKNKVRNNMFTDKIVLTNYIIQWVSGWATEWTLRLTDDSVSQMLAPPTGKRLCWRSVDTNKTINRRKVIKLYIKGLHCSSLETSSKNTLPHTFSQILHKITGRKHVHDLLLFSSIKKHSNVRHLMKINKEKVCIRVYCVDSHVFL